MTFVLSILGLLSFFWCLGKVVLLDCVISCVSLHSFAETPICGRVDIRVRKRNISIYIINMLWVLIEEPFQDASNDYHNIRFNGVIRKIFVWIFYYLEL